MKRQRAALLVEQFLERLDQLQDEWPLRLVTEVYVFGSFARGAPEPADVDLDIEFDGTDWQFASERAQALSAGRDPHGDLRRPLVGRTRGCQLVYNMRTRADFDLTLLWRRGDDLSVALERLRGIAVDPTAARAPRDAMSPEFEGLDRWLPRPMREQLLEAVAMRAIELERVALEDRVVDSPESASYLRERWQPGGVSFRAGQAVLAHYEQQGVDSGSIHLHGQDVRGEVTPYFAGFGLRYLSSAPRCLADHDGVEWLEVVRPTLRGELTALRIRPLDRTRLRKMRW
ncbi:nucleotidyltransferase domain-containing protein [Micromonospora tarensis]|uniref:Nucleotidyltransferase domain-containing protein n=1 Tax=Micromonospora tarensis TaxID=2806100 RepID=A0ABS1YIJ1_9ACTN|nr:nucleotidyltransferase domain-containing protein [Micromonospora tarensis]MBM0276976.1 nucleotidyltransferase domain-containing protein [Micromonospora tarensis]